MPQDLVTNGAQVSICNKYGETPLDKAKPHLLDLLKGSASKTHPLILHIASHLQLIETESSHFLSVHRVVWWCSPYGLSGSLREGREDGAEPEQGSLQGLLLERHHQDSTT